ncbi:MAG: prepilin-type N-terminal cleavage/methylation domain-containing protein [Planctomycetes bacterium]|jgi:type II secretory pathway pseudopilin PulG|nr:prepilin-type N-terminal cleavage/methylation domain-containing protein [Planctomycetota bacterium]
MARDRKRESGLTLIEVAVSMAVFCVGGLSVAATLGYTLRLNEVNRETAIATQEVRRVMEEIRALPLEDVIRTYNADPADDPDGYSTSPGSLFETASLPPPGGESGGARVDVVLPLSEGKLMENITGSILGSIGDLNGDGVIDGLDHTADAKILPLAVRIRWKGATGDRQLFVHTVLVR